MKCIAYFGKMHNNAKHAELYQQKSLPEHFPNTFIQYWKFQIRPKLIVCPPPPVFWPP